MEHYSEPTNSTDQESQYKGYSSGILTNDYSKSQLTYISKQSNFEVLKERVTQAAQNGKIFTIYGGFQDIRKELIKRGWIEKCAPNHLENIHKLPDDVIDGLRRSGNMYETVALSKLATNYNSYFIWQPNPDIIKTKERIKPFRNGIQRSNDVNFTTKQGLMNCIDNSYWNTEIYSPRYHKISNTDEHLDFLRDYRSTYCCNVLKFIIDNNPIDIFSKTGDLRLKKIEFAMDRISQEISIHTVTDIKMSSTKNPFGDQYKNDTEWQIFYSAINMLIQKSIKIRVPNPRIANDICITCRKLIDDIKKIWPLVLSEGYNNLWILKPSELSGKGRGVSIKNKYQEIINYVDRKPGHQYIVQKYIEQPLLIYNTKFMIRQHILLTIINDKFNIWMYTDCYLRFCPQEYDLNNLSDSIHLTNFSTQQEKYKNTNRNSNIPEYNMWELKDFKIFLKTLNKGDIWNNKIYPGMKKNIIGVVTASLEETDFIENTFDLYGCDFLIDHNCESILIEIISLPSMTRTSYVTAKLCPAVLKDLIKVVIDWANDTNADTGKFELISSSDFQTELDYVEYNKEFDIIGKSVKNISPPPKTHYRKSIENNINKLPAYLKNYRRPK